MTPTAEPTTAAGLDRKAVAAVLRNAVQVLDGAQPLGEDEWREIERRVGEAFGRSDADELREDRDHWRDVAHPHAKGQYASTLAARDRLAAENATLREVLEASRRFAHGVNAISQRGTDLDRKSYDMLVKIDATLAPASSPCVRMGGRE